MEPYIEQRLIQILRDSPAPTMPLRALHGRLAAESCATGSFALFAESLRRRHDLFVILETSSPLGDDPGWPAGMRSEYERALESAGFDAGPHVSLVDPAAETAGAPIDDDAIADPVEEPLRRLRDSLLHAWQHAGKNAALRSAIAAALAGCRDLPAVLLEPGDSS